MISTKLMGLSNADYVEYGYAQLEPNHLSAQRTGQIYAQLPANADIEVLEQGQFVKYDYRNGEVNYTGPGEWMLVYNETKLYRDGQLDCEFALIKDDYVARVYSPLDDSTLNWDAQSRYYGGKSGEGEDIEKVTKKENMYDLHYNEDPFHIESQTKPSYMKTGTTMVPRVFKTNVGDIFTTNCVKATELSLGDILTPGEDGYLKVGEGDMQWQVVKVYTMPDRQKGVKIMRIA
jgi:hypothetical protein